MNTDQPELDPPACDGLTKCVQRPFNLKTELIFFLFFSLSLCTDGKELRCTCNTCDGIAESSTPEDVQGNYQDAADKCEEEEADQEVVIPMFKYDAAGDDDFPDQIGFHQQAELSQSGADLPPASPRMPVFSRLLSAGAARNLGGSPSTLAGEGVNSPDTRNMECEVGEESLIVDFEMQHTNDLIDSAFKGLRYQEREALWITKTVVVSASSACPPQTILESDDDIEPVFVFTFPAAELLDHVKMTSYSQSTHGKRTPQHSSSADSDDTQIRQRLDSCCSSLQKRQSQSSVKLSPSQTDESPVFLIVTDWHDAAGSLLKEQVQGTLLDKFRHATRKMKVCVVGSQVYFVSGRPVKITASPSSDRDLRQLRKALRNHLRNSAKDVQPQFCWFPLAEYLLKLLQKMEPFKFSWMNLDQVQSLLRSPFLSEGFGAEANRQMSSKEGARQFVRYLTERGSALIPEKSVDDLDASTPICTNVAWMHERMSNVRAEKKEIMGVRSLLGRIGDDNSRAGTIILLDRHLIQLRSKICFECSIKERNADVAITNAPSPTGGARKAAPEKCKFCKRKVMIQHEKNLTCVLYVVPYSNQVHCIAVHASFLSVVHVLRPI